MNKKTSQEILLPENQGREYTDAVIVYFNKTLKDLDDLHNLSVQFWDLFNDEESACYDGHEYCCDLTHGSIYFYGNNAAEMFVKMKPLLEAQYFMEGALAKLIFDRKSSNEMAMEVCIGDPEG